MFAKLLTIILTSGAMAGSLLVIRQHRLDTAHEMVRIHDRITEADRMLTRLQGRVAEACTPEDLRLAVEELEANYVPLAFAPHDANWGQPTHIRRHTEGPLSPESREPDVRP